nr:MAG TPA: PhyR sigma-like domain, NepR anti transduction, response regulator, sigma [Caudoviricetes sp.]
MAATKKTTKKKKDRAPAQSKTASKELVKNDRDRLAIQKSTGKLAMDDRRLLTLAQAGASPAEMSEELGLPAETCLARVRAMLKRNDVWTNLERQQMLIADMYDLKTRAFDFLERCFESDEIAARHIEAVNSVLKQLGDRLDKVKEYNDEEEARVTKQQTRLILDLVEDAWERVRIHIAQAYANNQLLDPEAMDEVFYQALKEAHADQS